MLEQCLPDGDRHPFARKMLQHFAKLRSPLKCIQTYPTMEDQVSRFLDVGFHSAHARTLWDLWQDDSTFASPDSRISLNNVEPFDEWEEFALFCSHYFLLQASKGHCGPRADRETRLTDTTQSAKPQGDTPFESEAVTLKITSSPNNRRWRRFGAVIQFSDNAVGLHGGVGSKGRIQDTDRYRTLECEAQRQRLPDPPNHIPARVCHTVTHLQDGKDLLVGGRTSPDEALDGCWLRSSDGWSAVEDLPIPLYRHSATAVAVGRDKKDIGVLVFGGRTKGGRSVNQWFLWQGTRGWSKAQTTGPVDAVCRFGAAMVATHDSGGLLFGGMTEDGLLCDATLRWHIIYTASAGFSVQLEQRSDIRLPPRMGAHLLSSPVGLLLIGGVSRSLISNDEELICLSSRNGEKAEGAQQKFTISPITVDFGSSRPLLVGHAAFGSGNTVLVVGGGAVCFSFGQSFCIVLPTSY